MLSNEVTLFGWSTFASVPQPSSIVGAVAYMAKVSNPTGQLSNLNTDKLVSYLIKHKHWSPFEMANIVLEVTTARDISRQMIRHRSFSFQEWSQRYSATGTLAFPRECRLQDWQNRQNSLPNEDTDLSKFWHATQKDVADTAFGAYDKALKAGIAKEVARTLLPEGLTRTKLYVNGTVRSWIHYIELRSGVETQKEHRDLAIKCANAIEPVFPAIRTFVQGEGL